MRFLVLIVCGFAALWMVAASFDPSLSGSVRVYRLVDISDIDSPTEQPDKQLGLVTEYRISETSVLSKTWRGITEYQDCKVFDLRNWSCGLSDGSGWFRMREGMYSASYLDDWVYSAMQLEFYIYACRSAFQGGFVNGLFGCALAPFTT